MNEEEACNSCTYIGKKEKVTAKKLPRKMSATWTISPLSQPLERDTYRAQKITAQNER